MFFSILYVFFLGLVRLIPDGFTLAPLLGFIPPFLRLSFGTAWCFVGFCTFLMFALTNEDEKYHSPFWIYEYHEEQIMPLVVVFTIPPFFRFLTIYVDGVGIGLGFFVCIFKYGFVF